MQALLWLLLPIAAASGWWMARYSAIKEKNRSRAMLNSAYGQGLNYLLNEQADKAEYVFSFCGPYICGRAGGISFDNELVKD
jgi:lipopolysaccharide biosynthesis regulator YciM